MLRDPEAPSGSRLRAGELLLRAGGQFLIEDVDEPEDEDNFTQILLPWVRCRDVAPFSAVMMESGEIVPLSGHETDETLLYICPYDPETLREQTSPDQSAFEWNEEDKDE